MIKLPSLHLNSEYTLLGSTIKIDKLIKIAKENDLKELVITDRNNMYGVADFIFKTKKAGIKPIIGLDLDVDKYRFVLLAKNYDGYKELMRLSSLKEKNINITMKDVNDFDIFIIDHPTEGFFAKENREPTFTNFYVGSTTSTEANAVWFNETKIFTKKENEALDIMSSISGNEIKHNFEPMQIEYDENDHRVIQAKQIMDSCNIEFPKNLNPLPEYKKGIDKNKYFKQIIVEAFSKVKIDKNRISEYKERINMEVSIVSKLGFIDYFLIIWDLIAWAKKQGISIGPGRGSAAGSLISYLLGITEVDPIKFDLLFERFLNPERISMPDIDIDIQDNRREEVVNYLFEKYGEENVGLISTFSTIGAKTSLRDVARTMGMPLRDVDAISKLANANMSLEESYNNLVRFRAAIDKTSQTRELFEKAKLIEGLPRQRGTHAAGIVISDSPLLNKVPTTISSEGHNQTQFTMDHLEEHGLLKIDLLGLRNLTIIQSIQEEIYKNYHKKVDLNKIPLNDETTNSLLTSGNTNGIFQLESHGMKRTLKQVGVSNFDDLVSIISLFRPGPMEFIPEYSDVKKGKIDIKNIHPIYDEIVKPTRGIIVFQEQIMQISQRLTGMSFGQADILRRAISKKKRNLINTLKEEFVKGAIKNGLSKDKAIEIYGNIEKFADYGFNKSHAVSYGILAYRLAFLKARFPFEFYTALIRASSGSQTQVQKYVTEAKSEQITVIAPNVNKSEETVINKNKKIILPLTIIKGFGEAANKKIINAKKEFKKFDDLFDFVSKVKIHNLGDSQIQTLIEANALRDFGNMRTLLDSLPSAIRYAEMTLEKTPDGFKFSDLDLPKPLLIKQKEDITYEMNAEIKAFGFNLSVFPTSGKELSTKIASLEYNETEEVVVLVNSIRKVKDKNGNSMGIIKLSDSTSQIEAMAFEDVFKFIEDTKKGTVVKSLITKREFKGQDTYRISKPWKEL